MRSTGKNSMGMYSMSMYSMGMYSMGGVSVADTTPQTRGARRAARGRAPGRVRARHLIGVEGERRGVAEAPRRPPFVRSPVRLRGVLDHEQRRRLRARDLWTRCVRLVRKEGRDVSS